MIECEKCGISESHAKIHEVIGKEGILRLCEKCLAKESLPLIKKPSTIQLKNEEKIQNETYRNSIKRFRESHKEMFKVDQEQEKNLRELVEQNYKKTNFDEPKDVSGLVDNFHWKIMRARRMTKLNKKELAKEIGEAEAAIEMIEKGVLPRGSDILVKKLETFLKIKLKKEHETIQKIKKEIKKDLEKKPEDTLFDPEINKNITIGDLKKVKEKKRFFWQKKDKEEVEEDIDLDFEPKEIKFKTDPFKKDREEVELNKKIRNRELTQEEIDKIVFGG